MAQLCRYDESDICNGKVVGLFRPLSLRETPQDITVEGETFSLRVSRRTGQLISAKVLGDEYIVPGTGLPDPYLGLFPEDDPGASPLGDSRTRLYGFEKATRFKPPMYSTELTNAPERCDASDSVDVRVAVEEAGPCAVRIVSSGEFAFKGKPCGVEWKITFDIDVDGFTRVDVEAFPRKPVLLQWHGFLHARISRSAARFVVPWSDHTLAEVTGFGVLPPIFLADRPSGEVVFGARVCPYVHVGNERTGIEFTKEVFDGRLAGYRDAKAQIGEFTNYFDRALAQDGTWVGAADSRGRRNHLTQVILHDDCVELEDFDVRNTTYAFNPGDRRHRYFFLQLTPPKQAREDLNDLRVEWQGPHQIVMSGWNSEKEWEPPSDEQIAEWKRQHVNLISGGINYFDGDAPSATVQEKVRAFLKSAHEAGIRVIPYITFNDFEFGAREYRTLSTAWFNSQCLEYKNQTTLMCFGADGWREHFEKQAEWLMSNFDFDGLYVDHWASTRLCANDRHGCGHVPFRWVTEGYHDIAKRVRRVVARHTQGKGILMLNTGGDPFTGCLSFFDIRLMGENIDLRRVPERDLVANMNPYRQGAHGLIYPSRWGNHEIFFNYAAVCGYSVHPNVWKGAPREGREILEGLWRVHAEFDTNRARKIPTFCRSGILEIGGTGTHVNAYCREGQVLLIGGCLPTASLPPLDTECLAGGIRGALLDAGLDAHVADALLPHLRPYFKPANTTGTLDSLELAQQSEAVLEYTRNEGRAERVRVVFKDPKALGLQLGRRFIIRDLLGKAEPSPLEGDSFELTLRDHYPFAILVQPL